MDQGTASVLGASAAAVGVLATAVFTYRGSRRQPRDQGQVEHGRALREERRTAYEGFIAATGQIDKALREFDPRRSDYLRAVRPWLPSREAVGRCVEHLATAMRELGEVKAKAELVGPDSVATAADDLWQKVIKLHDQVARSRRSTSGVNHIEQRKVLRRLAQEMETSRRRFAKKSRSALLASR